MPVFGVVPAYLIQSLLDFLAFLYLQLNEVVVFRVDLDPKNP